MTSHQVQSGEDTQNKERREVEQAQPLQKHRTPQVATALHILKGAVVKVLHTPLTTSVKYEGKTRGHSSFKNFTHRCL